MIIIYQGRNLVLPLAACYLHFNRHQSVWSMPSPQWWRRKGTVFHIIGSDRDGNMVCALATGCHGLLYSRVLHGLGEIFNVPLHLVNVDQLVNHYYPFYSAFRLKLYFASFFPAYSAEFLLKILLPLLKKDYSWSKWWEIS